MLHFLAIVALCLFIGERLVHYWSAYRLCRNYKRGMELLNVQDRQQTGLIPPPSASEPSLGGLRFTLTTLTLLFVALFILAAIAHG